jgi:hypothetical protein
MKRVGVVLTDPQGKKYRTFCFYDENDNLMGFLLDEYGEQMKENLELVLQSEVMAPPEEPEDVPMVTMSQEKLDQMEMDGAGDFADFDDEDDED